MRRALAWIILTAGIAALYHGFVGVSCACIIAWLVLLGQGRPSTTEQ
jgi:hypothetical protein